MNVSFLQHYRVDTTELDDQLPIVFHTNKSRAIGKSKNAIGKETMRYFINLMQVLTSMSSLHPFFYKEPTSRPSSKNSLFIDLNSANCSTKSSLIVP